MIAVKIDVTKIDKSRLFVGKKGTYLSCVLIETPGNTYGNDYMIVESVTTEERKQGVQGCVIGNAKIIVSQPNPTPETERIADADTKNDLPF